MTEHREQPRTLSREERKRMQDQEQRAARLAAYRRRMDTASIAERFARDAPCSRCDTGIVPVILASMVGDPRCLCEGCSRQTQPRAARLEDVTRAQADAFARRLDRTNLQHQPRIVAALRLTPEDPDPEVVQGHRWRPTLAACTTYRVKAPPGSLMVLSGPSQAGKSTSSALLAWQTHGRYLPREQWTRLNRYGDTSELDWLLGRPGVVVLDEVCLTGPRGVVDNNHDMAVVDLVVKGRHARKLGTVLTTNATEAEFLEFYGNVAKAVWARTMDLTGEVVGAGWVDCTPRRDVVAGGGDR